MENSIFDSRFEKFFFEEGELDSNFKMIHSDLNNVREKKKNGNFWIVLEACFFNNNDDVGRDFLIFILDYSPYDYAYSSIEKSTPFVEIK